MAKRGASTDPTRADDDKYRSQIGEEVRAPLTKSQLDKLHEIIEDVPDVNDPDVINYWVKLDDYDIYIEGWCDECLSGTGFPTMERGGTQEKLNYMEDLTPGILEREAKERGLELVDGGFRELPDATYLYGVTWGVYRKPSGNPGHNPGNPGPLTPEEEERIDQILHLHYLLKPEHHEILERAQAYQHLTWAGAGTPYFPGGQRGALNLIEELLDAYPYANPERQEQILRQIARASETLKTTPELTYHVPVHRKAPPSLAEVRHVPPSVERRRITERLENPGNPGPRVSKLTEEDPMSNYTRIVIGGTGEAFVRETPTEASRDVFVEEIQHQFPGRNIEVFWDWKGSRKSHTLEDRETERLVAEIRYLNPRELWNYMEMGWTDDQLAGWAMREGLIPIRTAKVVALEVIRQLRPPVKAAGYEHHSWSTPRAIAAIATGALTGLVGSAVPVVGLAGGLLAQILEKQTPQLQKAQHITAGVVDGSAALLARSLFRSAQARPMKLTLTEEELDKLEFEAAKKGEYVPSPPRPTKEQFKEILREKLLKKD